MRFFWWILTLYGTFPPKKLSKASKNKKWSKSHIWILCLVFSLKMRFLHILIQDEIFPISHAGWDFSVFLCYMRLFVRRLNKKTTLLRPLHYVLAVKKLAGNFCIDCWQIVWVGKKKWMRLETLHELWRPEKTLNKLFGQALCDNVITMPAFTSSLSLINN